ncbi:MAG: hypothetical protein QW035_00040 [Candidatus Anstonellales archaeon]
MKNALLLLMLLNPLFACVALDHQFTVFISVDFDSTLLSSLCTKDTCAFSGDYITLRSPSNPEVAIIFVSSQDRHGILFRLPYSIAQDGAIQASSIDPANFDWPSLVSSDLLAMKDAGIISLSDSEISLISSLSSSSKNIYYCAGQWKALEANCICSNGQEYCMRCFGDPAIQAPLPSSAPYFLTKPQPIALYILSFVILLLVLIGGYVLATRKK